MESETRVGYGEDQDTTAGEGSGGTRDKTHSGQVRYELDSFELTLYFTIKSIS